MTAACAGAARRRVPFSLSFPLALSLVPMVAYISACADILSEKNSPGRFSVATMVLIKFKSSRRPQNSIMRVGEYSVGCQTCQRFYIRHVKRSQEDATKRAAERREIINDSAVGHCCAAQRARWGLLIAFSHGAGRLRDFGARDRVGGAGGQDDLESRALAGFAAGADLAAVRGDDRMANAQA